MSDFGHPPQFSFHRENDITCPLSFKYRFRVCDKIKCVFVYGAILTLLKTLMGCIQKSPQ